MADGDSGGFDWGALLGGLANAGGAYLGAQYGPSQAGQVGQLGEKAASWTQLLGLSTIGQFGGTLQAGNQGLLSGYGNAAQLTSQLPGVAAGGTQAQLGQLAGAEQGAISHALKAQTAQMGQVGQQGAASGFYGSSAQQGIQNQVSANTSQTIADIMAGSAQAKAGVIGQGTGATMSGIIAAAQGSQAMGEAFAKASGAEYNLMKDKLNTILATGNAWAIGDSEQKVLMKQAGGLPSAGLHFPSWYGAPGQPFEEGPWYNHPNADWSQWASAFAPWLSSVQGDLASIWG